MLVVTIVAASALGWALFNRSFSSYIPVTLVSDRAGLMMANGGKVKLRGVDVGQVEMVNGGGQPVSLKLQMFPDQLKYIPANVEAEIKATTVFGAKYVELIYPPNPSDARLTAGAVLHSRNVSTEVNTVFQNLVALLRQIDPVKLNATLATLADGFRGQGQRMGEAIADANAVLAAVNSRSDTLRMDLRSLSAFSETYSAAAQDIVSVLRGSTVTATTITNHAKALDSLLVNVIGLAQSGTDLVGPNKENLIGAINILEPTTTLLMKYSPEYTCLLMGSKWFLDNGGYQAIGGNGYSLITDTGLLLGNDTYVYPDNLPIVAAKGGPGGKPGCGSLPDASKNFPVRMMVTNTGWGTGIDLRPNIGLGHPCWVNYLPVTRSVPEQPSVRCQGPPSPGLVVPAPGPLPLPPAP